ncbi:MAG TPA: LUD domain-containing protein, partial [Acidimicrobiales bacterium]|nr:LUD domain-containing protein [Acidimicrobiales bacterium]
LRSSLADGSPPPHRPLATLAGVPEVALARVDGSVPVTERWAQAWEALGGRVHRTTEDDVGAAVDAAVAGRGPVLIDQRFDLDVAGLERLEWPGCGLEAAAMATSGVIEATAAIAATGSIVVDTARAGRLVSLLPRIAVFVVPASAVVGTTGDVLRRHRDLWPAGPPTNVVLVTGPSRSGDIEMRLVVGVHGPGEVHAVLVEDG